MSKLTEIWCPTFYARNSTIIAQNRNFDLFENGYTTSIYVNLGFVKNVLLMDFHSIL
jgi:hypothetical protein